MRVFVACLHLFGASVEHFFSPFLTNVLFLCIIGKKDTKKGETNVRRNHQRIDESKNDEHDH